MFSPQQARHAAAASSAQGNLIDLAQDVVQRVLRGGASDAECVIQEGESFSVRVRLGEVERLKESGSKAIGLRVLLGKRSASSYSSDFSPAGIGKLVASALEAARFTSEDPYADLPNVEQLGFAASPEALDLFRDDVLATPAAERIDLARRCEQAAMDADPRITNSDGAAYSAGSGRIILANSRGFTGSYRTSSCSLSATAVAESSAGKERDSWYTAARSPVELDAPEQVGLTAAERALRRLGARHVPTAEVPVVFEPTVARSLLQTLFAAVSGSAIYRKSSFLADKLGEQIAAETVTVVDDGLRPGGFGSAPFDDEGVAKRRTPVVRRGKLESYLLNCYAARKLGLETTGNASRGLAGSPGVGPGNFLIEPGPHAPDEILRSVSEGLLVTELIGFGVNLVTGDYSRGAAGLWIRNGEPVFPVSEVTIAGNLKSMLLDLEMVGSDLDLRASIIAPTLKISRMTVAGR